MCMIYISKILRDQSKSLYFYLFNVNNTIVYSGTPVVWKQINTAEVQFYVKKRNRSQLTRIEIRLTGGGQKNIINWRYYINREEGIMTGKEILLSVGVGLGAAVIGTTASYIATDTKTISDYETASAIIANLDEAEYDNQPANNIEESEASSTQTDKDNNVTSTDSADSTAENNTPVIENNPIEGYSVNFGFSFDEIVFNGVKMYDWTGSDLEAMRGIITDSYEASCGPDSDYTYETGGKLNGFDIHVAESKDDKKTNIYVADYYQVAWLGSSRGQNGINIDYYGTEDAADISKLSSYISAPCLLERTSWSMDYFEQVFHPRAIIANGEPMGGSSGQLSIYKADSNLGEVVVYDESFENIERYSMHFYPNGMNNSSEIYVVSFEDYGDGRCSLRYSVDF